MSQTQTVLSDAELKARHRAMWALGDYPKAAADLVAPMGAELVAATGIGAGDDVLDVAAGAGNAAIAAALIGAHVIAADLTPELLAAGERAAVRAGVRVRWRQADAEALPYDDDTFDVVLSCIGVMFAPHHQVAADELVRVCRPGGRLGLACWTPEGFIGRMFAAMKPYAPPAPSGVQSPPSWGSEDYLGDLFGYRLARITVERRLLPVTRFSTPEEFRDYFKTNYGPTVAVYGALGPDRDRITALDTALADLARASQDSSGAMEWEYLLLTATVR